MTQNLPHRAHKESVSPPNLKLSRALNKVSRAWFPANPTTVSKLLDGLEKGAYDLDIDFLITEIQSDFALYT